MIMKKFLKLFGVDFFTILVWSGMLILGTYFFFRLYEPLAGVFIGWYMIDTIYSLRSLKIEREFEKYATHILKIDKEMEKMGQKPKPLNLEDVNEKVIEITVVKE